MQRVPDAEKYVCSLDWVQDASCLAAGRRAETGGSARRAASLLYRLFERRPVGRSALPSAGRRKPCLQPLSRARDRFAARVSLPGARSHDRGDVLLFR